MSKSVTNLIIGAGPAGLAVAGRMRKAGIDFTMVEKSDHPGNSWRNHYDRLHLHTVKQLSNLPHLDFPDSYPLYVPRGKVVEYLEGYAKHFNIKPLFGEEITQISKSDLGGWNVESSNGNQYESANVIIATGLNRAPYFAHWPGEEKFQGGIIHSINYKNPDPYLTKRTLVVGMGNTGAEIALDLAQHNVPTFISMRGEVSIVPRDLNGRPVQLTAKQLEKLPFGLGDWLGSKIRKIYFGDLSKYGINTSKQPPVVQLREHGKTPLIDIGTIKMVKQGKIKVVGEIDHFRENGIVLKSGSKVDVEAVILATGYRAQIEDFLERGAEIVDSHGWPKQVVGDHFHKGIFFVGFDNYKLGGILGTIYTDSKIILDAIQAQKTHSV